MKKICLILSLLIVLTSCKSNTNNSYNYNEITESNMKNEIVQEEKYIDTNPIKIGIYKDNKLVSDYYTNINDSTDIGVFGILYTNNRTIESSNYKYLWKKYYNNYQDIDNYKTGFYLEFDTSNGHIENMILDPSSTRKAYPYIAVFLYDDVHQDDNSWYRHLESGEENDNAIYSSIKLFVNLQAEEIISPIYFTAFTYKDEYDFDDNGYYRGNSKYTVTIYKK